MNKRKIILIAFYLLNLIAVFTVITFISDNRFLNLILAMYLIIFSAIFFYANRHKN